MPSQDKKELIEKYGESLFAADGDNKGVVSAVPKAEEAPKPSSAPRHSASKHHSSNKSHSSGKHHSSSKSHSSSKHHSSGKHHSSSSKKHKSSSGKKGIAGIKRRINKFFSKNHSISKETEKKLKKWSIIISAVIVVVLIVLFIVIALDDMDNEEKVQKQEQQFQSDKSVEELKTEKAECESQLAALEQEYKDTIKVRGHAMIVAVDPDSTSLASMSAKMDSHNYDGIIALSSAYFRNNTKYASFDEINALKGWDIAVVIDSETELKNVYNKCIANGLGIPKAVYARNARLTDSLCDKIINMQISLVFCSANNEQNDPDLIYVNVLPFNTESTKAVFLSSIEEGQNLGCIIGTENSGSVYNEVQFERMLNTFDGQKKGDDSAVSTASAEIYRVKDYSKQSENQEKEYETKISSLQTKLEDINDRISQKQNEYYNANS